MLILELHNDDGSFLCHRKVYNKLYDLGESENIPKSYQYNNRDDLFFVKGESHDFVLKKCLLALKYGWKGRVAVNQS